MSKRSSNHSKGTMTGWRGMAAEGEDADELFQAMPHLLGRNARWRPIVRLIAKERGWTFADAFFWHHLQGFNHMWGVSSMHTGTTNA